MMMSKEQLVEGISTYIKEEVIKNIPDNSLKIILNASLFTIRNNSSLLEQKIFTNSTFCALFNYDNGYNLDSFIDGLRHSIEEYGNLVFTIPAIPMISKENKELSFTGSDVDVLKRYLERSVSNVGYR